jgi:SAM-dependent MidA family methyltransferase
MPPLPDPGPEAHDASRKLAARIRAEIADAGGWLRFDRYMDLALYAPGLGYYAGGSAKLGPSGDFVTAPELGPELARALAAQFEYQLAALHDPVLLELGAGRGTLAVQILEALRERGVAEVPYHILEPSPELADRQRRRLASYGGRVQWLDRLPNPPLDAVVIANEVMDALPVAVFVKRGAGVVPLGVAAGPSGLEWAEGGADASVSRAVAALETELGGPLPEGYRSEICLLLPAWVAALAQSLRRGFVWLVDYGYSRRDYYDAARTSGTLICHYRHRAHADPFFLPGLTDLSAWVDFTAVAEAAVGAGLAVAGYTTQGQFLIEGLGPALLARAAADARAASALKTLVLPGEMGERFKVMLLAKGVEARGVPGRDFRDRL